MPTVPLPALEALIKPMATAPRARIEALPSSLPVIALAEDGFALVGSRLEPGSCTRVAFEFGRHVSVSVHVRAEQAAESVQRFSVVDIEDRALMRVIQALSDQELADWLAAAPTSSFAM